MFRITVAKLAFLAALAALAIFSSSAQEVSDPKPPPYRGVRVYVAGVYVTPVPGVPVTAIVELQSVTTLPDGSRHIDKTFNNIARDFKGRIYNERRQWINPATTREPAIISFHLYDPVTHLNTFLEPATHLARQSMFPERKSPAGQEVALPATTRNPQVVVDELGTKTMEGVLVRGLLRTRTVPANDSGTGKIVEITDEYWYSDELRLNMAVRHEDPRTGQQIVTVTKLRREEPDPDTFEIPAGYKIVDENPATTD
ncbi:MAG TPA: hypothetical protein VMP12_13570 [Candidatus Sulfotelmatobacter sp.]|nr:hypothetical protein [Candidatus Sulfotelmatobacter sp.]